MPKSRAPHPPAEHGCRRLILCTGKVFYNLHARRAAAGLDKGTIAIVRLEQLAPFPHDLVCRELRRYPGADVVWCQEEPMNMGAYHHVQPRLVTCLEHEGRSTPGGHIPYAGREPSAASATGFAEVYKEEQNDLIAAALNLGDPLLRRAKPRRRATIWHSDWHDWRDWND
jgi:2-oxoglutarate dehydrogenase E1 component